MSTNSLIELRDELQEALTKIYNEYLQDFRKRKAQRLENLRASDPPEQYQLVVETNYRNELTQKVKQIVHQESYNMIYRIFYDAVHQFVSDIFTDLASLESQSLILRILCLAEAFHTVENSARELGKITTGIFEKEPTYITCENVTKLAFFDKVLKHFENIIEAAPSIADKSCVVNDVINLNLELRSLSNRLRSSTKSTDKVFKEDSQRMNSKLILSGEDNTNDDVSFMSVDDIVSFINGDERDMKKKRRSKGKKRCKASTASTSGSPKSEYRDMEYPELEKEIEEFSRRLEFTVKIPRLKPKFSEEWIKCLRDQITKIN
mmetsp:Transcript_25845/g.25391  ORF Transcript_25845/g.25391 Transcript_25845/m.25391 type:complete len:320 (-) Transcript_25845:18-977(-)|eukprot:CAMPEP_0202948934 /NCGR_PEP_ID=MMETSP1395-20130829/14782_1 /ASSEMBLY_ACC=CAM_ASM_000871 /TAXON_ID=5961 /ORGANISM="Blepharisma japonicum, Strain Stock R1072" /LENGTH=319 /DNA_ID=CAMNT_0049651499 /DNA_START=18 /DNA_END=974 /DNA_ORIENTATION=-